VLLPLRAELLLRFYDELTELFLIVAADHRKLLYAHDYLSLHPIAGILAWRLRKPSSERQRQEYMTGAKPSSLRRV
jgi:hypothetical protein